MPHCGDIPFSHFSPFSRDVLNDEAKFKQALRCVDPSDVEELFSDEFE